MAAAASPTERILIAGPSSLLSSPQPTASSASSRRQFLLLPHPRTSAPTYFLPAASSSSSEDPSAEEYDELYELQAVKSDRKARSWFLGGACHAEMGSTGQGSEEPRGSRGENGWILQDSTLHLLTRIDPVFPLLAMLDVLLPSPSPSSSSASLQEETGSYLTLEDLFESISSILYRRLLDSHKTLSGGKTSMKDEQETTWNDVLIFGQLALTSQALKRVCTLRSTSSTTTTREDEVYYRASPRAIVDLLKKKVETLAAARVFEDHPATLGRALDRSIDDPLREIARANGQLSSSSQADVQSKGDDIKSRKGRVEIALDIVRGYIPKDGRIEELFEKVVAKDLLSECEDDHQKRNGQQEEMTGGSHEEDEEALRQEEAKSGNYWDM